MDEIAQLKKMAAEQAVELIEPGMIVGLGVGSTAIFALQKIAAKLKAGQLNNVLGIPCSLAVEQAAIDAGIPLTSLNIHPKIDLTIDGADEVDPVLNLIKGGGGALLREKIVAQASEREVIVVDEGKLSQQLGMLWAVPVEVIPFGWQSQAEYIVSLGGEPKLRLAEDGTPYKTDQRNHILDCNFGPIKDPATLSIQLNIRTGIVEHGLFINLVTEVIVAGKDGLRLINKP